MSISPEEAFNDLCGTLRLLGADLSTAVDIRYESPSGIAPSTGDLVSNPTLDTVLDRRRWAVSQAVSSAAMALRLADVRLVEAKNLLNQAIRAWEGERTTNANTPPTTP